MLSYLRLTVLLLFMIFWLDENKNYCLGFQIISFKPPIARGRIRCRARRLLSGANNRRNVFSRPLLHQLHLTVPKFNGDHDGIISSTISSSVDVVPLNGEIKDDINITAASLKNETGELMLPLAPPVTYDKFLTMQEKRVVVTIRYTGDSGLKPYYLTVAKKLKASHPDVLIERRILPALPGDTPVKDLVFDILVDGKIVVGTKRSRKKSGAGVDDVTGGKSVYISMMELDLAISKARRRRRPSTMYGESGSEGLGLDLLRKANEEQSSWND